MQTAEKVTQFIKQSLQSILRKNLYDVLCIQFKSFVLRNLLKSEGF